MEKNKFHVSKISLVSIILACSLFVFSIATYASEPTFSNFDNPEDYSSNANNLDHAYDENYNTSANIFSQDGFIVYTLNQLNFETNDNILFTMNAADGSTKEVYVQTLDENGEIIIESVKQISIEGFKNSYFYNIPENGVYIKISGVSTTALYIYEIELSTAPLKVNMSKYSNNLDHAYDGNENTSANIFSESGYIIYDLDELSLLASDTVRIQMNSSDGTAKPVLIEFMDNQGNNLEEDIVVLTVGYKNSYSFDIPELTEYIKINGVSGSFLYIYEIQPSDTSLSLIMNLYSNNYDHAYDGSLNTSANIFTENGFIIYSLDELSVLPGKMLKLTLNASDGRESTLSIICLDEDLNPIESSDQTFEISGYKSQYIFNIHADASFIKINGMEDVPLYIYEIEENTVSNNINLSKNANNLDHAYDNNYNTSANIFNQTGYIIYNIQEIGLEARKNSVLILNASDGRTTTIQVETLNESGNLIDGSSTNINITGYKDSYLYYVPQNSVYIKIYGISDVALYIYEIAGPGAVDPNSSFATATDNGDGTFLLEVTVIDNLGYPVTGLEIGDGGDFRAINEGTQLPYPLYYFNTTSIPDVELVSSINGVYKFMFTRPFGWSRTWNILVQDIEIQTGLLLEATEDLTNPDLIFVLPDRGAVELESLETFVITVNAFDEYPLSHLEIDHSLESILPEFNVYANEENPYGSNEAKLEFDTYGVNVTYDKVKQEWVIDFGHTITDILVDNGGITFYLVVYDMAGNQFGTMYGTTPENTFAYTITR